jgi:hydrogenase nickel incorporation protein HypA/HybF
MHELSVTEEVLNITLDHADKARAARVLKVNLVIGELTCFMEESVRFYFDIMSEGTIADKALLSISSIPAMGRCGQCRLEFVPKRTDWLCPRCGGSLHDLISGREFYVESIEIE